MVKDRRWKSRYVSILSKWKIDAFKASPFNQSSNDEIGNNRNITQAKRNLAWSRILIYIYVRRRPNNVNNNKHTHCMKSRSNTTWRRLTWLRMKRFPSKWDNLHEALTFPVNSIQLIDKGDLFSSPHCFLQPFYGVVLKWYRTPCCAAPQIWNRIFFPLEPVRPGSR